jgi:hypothetical protein
LSKVFGNEEGQVGGCYQMLSIVDGKPEELVYFNCSGIATSAPATVVHAVALERVKDKLKKSGFVEATRVKVRRTELQLGLVDAMLLREVWEKMVELAEVELGFVMTIREYVRDYYVSACNAGCLGAVIKTPPRISPGADLVALGEVLAEVTDSTPDRRPELLNRLHSMADELARKIRPMKPKVRRLFRWEAVVRHVYTHPEPDGGLEP